MWTPRQMLHTLLFAGVIACGDDPPADAQADEPAPVTEDGEPPPAPTQDFDPDALTGEVGPDCDPKLTGKTCGHPDGPLRRERNLFFGLVKTGRDLRFRDGRSLTGYGRRAGSRQAYKVGDATFDDAQFYFDRHRLRLHRVVKVGMSPAECALAPPKITEDYGSPLVNKRGEMMWRLDWIEIRWLDTAINGSNPTASRCQVEYRDRSWFQAR
jgi:hypothetical protein